MALLVVAACGVEKMPPIHMANRGAGSAHRAIVLPMECTGVEQDGVTVDPRAWCNAMDAMVASELSFRGVEIVDLAKLPARERTRTSVQVSSLVDGVSSEMQTVTVSGPMFSDVDLWTQRAALDALGVDALVRVRIARLPTYPLRTLALIRITRLGDASLIGASVCELEVSRLASDVQTIERAMRCALKGLPR